jgi:hypothetical protein
MRVTSVCEHPEQDQCIVLVRLQSSTRFDRDIFPFSQEEHGRIGLYPSPHIWGCDHILYTLTRLFGCVVRVFTD